MIANIKSVAVLGAGTMGAGIAALAAEKDCNVLLLDISEEAAITAKNKMINAKSPMLEDLSKIENIKIGNFNDHFQLINNYDWICEVVIEKLDIKRDIFKKIEKYRSDGSVVSSNTSGIPLKDITSNMPERLLSDVCITHFFNPVKIMKLCELIPGSRTSSEVIKKLRYFLINTLDKGVVNGKDTVNFIGNRIGCYLMLKGLHEGKKARNMGLSQEHIDALISKPMGLPPTGLYGLIDLIGLDVMFSVGKNLAINLPEDDIGRDYVDLPPEEKKMYDIGQLGRKSGGGFYRLLKSDQGIKKKEVFDLSTSSWRDFKKIDINRTLDIIFEDSIEGQFAWNVMGSTLCYAANLVPEIADDIVNIDRAMKWGFAWNKGPFEMLDEIGPKNFIKKCKLTNSNTPKMLKILERSGGESFYNSKNQYLSINGYYVSIQN